MTARPLRKTRLWRVLCFGKHAIFTSLLHQALCMHYAAPLGTKKWLQRQMKHQISL